jgi:hypothetical protein
LLAATFRSTIAWRTESTTIASVSGPDTRETEQDGLRDAISVLDALLVGMTEAHEIASIIEYPPHEQGRRPRIFRHMA